MPQAEDNIIIGVTSIFGYKTRKGLVGITIGDRKTFYMTPQEARSTAADILQCATAAEIDEMTVWYLTNRIGLDLERATLALRDMRLEREKQYGRQINMTPDK